MASVPPASSERGPGARALPSCPAARRCPSPLSWPRSSGGLGPRWTIATACRLQPPSPVKPCPCCTGRWASRCVGMQWAEGSRVHLAVSVAARVADVDDAAVTAHCGVTQPGGRQVASGSPRRQATPGSDTCPWTGLRRRAAGAAGAAQPLWLGHSSVPGLPGVGRLPESGAGCEDGGLHPCPSLHPLPQLPGGKLLCHQHSVQIMLHG